MKRIFLYLKAVRYRENFLLMGMPFMGIVFSADSINSYLNLKIPLLFAAVFFYYGFVFLYNDITGYNTDRISSRKKDSPLIKGSIDKKEARLLAAALFFLSSLIFLRLSLTIFILFLLNAAFWTSYSHPNIRLKARPVLPTLLHLFSGVSHFLFGFLLLSGNNSAEGILAGIFFGLVFSAGHLIHEIIDIDADRKNGFKTSAVYYGKKPVFICAVLLFSLSFIYLIFLSYSVFIPRYTHYFLTLFYPLFIYRTVNIMKKGLNKNNITAFRGFYRKLFAGTGIYIFILRTVTLL